MLSCVQLFVTPWTVAYQAPPVHGILQARILEWVAISFSRGIVPTQGSNPCLLCLLLWQADSLPLCHLGSPIYIYIYEIMKIFFISFYKIFKYYTPLTVITKYQLFSPCCIVHPWACLNPNSLCLPLPYPYTAGSPTLAPLVTTGLFSISMGLLLFCYITSLLYFLDSIHKRYHRVFVFLCLTCPFLKGNVMINLFSTWRDHNIWPNTSLVIMMKVYFGKDQYSNQ